MIIAVVVTVCMSDIPYSRYPLITLSTRAQIESERARASWTSAARHILAREGIPGLYSGLRPALYGVSLTNFVFFYWLEWTRAVFSKASSSSPSSVAASAAAVAKGGNASSAVGTTSMGRSRYNHTRRLSTIQDMSAAAIAGSATVIVTNPIWVVSTQAKAANDHNSSGAPGECFLLGEQKKARPPSTLSVLWRLLAQGDVRALFAGVFPALVHVLSPVVQHTVFEHLKNLTERTRRRKITPQDLFLLGALSKAVAITIIYPFITVSSRMSKEKRKRVSMSNSLRKIFVEEGFRGLYIGKAAMSVPNQHP